MKYSIILPCYNVAKYLNRCLDSIYSNNNISDCEVILVDDGSTDNFKKICKKYFDVTDELLAKSESEFEFGGGGTSKLFLKKIVVYLQQEIWGCGKLRESIFSLLIRMIMLCRGY